MLVRWDGRPAGGWSSAGGLVSDVQGAQGNECFESSVDTAGFHVAMKQAHNLILRQGSAGAVNGFADTVGDGISGGPAEEEGGAGVAVIPYGEGSLEVRQGDDRGAIEGCVDGAEAQDLGFGAASGGAALAGVFLLGLPAHRRRWRSMLTLVCLATIIAGIGCGGGGGSSSTAPPTNPTPPTSGATPAGTYTIVVTGTQGTSLAHAIAVTVLVTASS